MTTSDFAKVTEFVKNDIITDMPTELATWVEDGKEYVAYTIPGVKTVPGHIIPAQ